MISSAQLLRQILSRRSQNTEDLIAQMLDCVGDASIVLFGEATHGTKEFYSLRAEFSKALIRERGFRAIVAEADWPDAYRVNRYVRHASDDQDAAAALGNFERFPRWMWCNDVVADFVAWLREFNQRCLPQQQVGFYGMDLYSLSASVAAVLDYLESVSPQAAAAARARYACFDMFLEEPQRYGYAATLGLTEDCERVAIEQLVELRTQVSEEVLRVGLADADEQFWAEQNALVVQNAERYYRAMFGEFRNSWNIRDTHMFDTLISLQQSLSRDETPAKLIVWAHNSHVGNAEATEAGQRGEVNVGNLVRRRFGSEARLIGFSTYRGSVTAASEWGGPAETKMLRPSLPESFGELFHEVGLPRFFLRCGEGAVVEDILDTPRLQRAVGVIYRPETERFSHYFTAHLPRQFDAIAHIDFTSAVRPLKEESTLFDEFPETFPTGL
jgi:erythromycin esterase-like protein